MQPRILYPVRLSLKTQGEIKSFQDKQKLKEFANTKPKPSSTGNIERGPLSKRDPKSSRSERNRDNYTVTVTLQAIQWH